MDFPFYEEENENGWICVGDGPDCTSCLDRVEQLEAEGKEVIRECCTCCNNDY